MPPGRQQPDIQCQITPPFHPHGSLPAPNSLQHHQPASKRPECRRRKPFGISSNLLQAAKRCPQWKQISANCSTNPCPPKPAKPTAPPSIHYLGRIPVDLSNWQTARECARLLEDTEWAARSTTRHRPAGQLRDQPGPRPGPLETRRRLLHAWDILCAERRTGQRRQMDALS